MSEKYNIIENVPKNYIKNALDAVQSRENKIRILLEKVKIH